MKPSRRNLANLAAKDERKAKGKPELSKYEKKTRTPIAYQEQGQ